MEEEGVRWLEWKGYFLQPNNSTKDFVNKSGKAKNNYNRWLQCTVYIDDTIINFLPPDSGPLPPQ